MAGSFHQKDMLWSGRGLGLQPLLPSAKNDIVKPQRQEVETMPRPKTDSEPITLRLPRELIEAIDALRRDEKDLPTRPEMIRRLLVKQLGQDVRGLH
jgi:hypothetical protein